MTTEIGAPLALSQFRRREREQIVPAGSAREPAFDEISSNGLRLDTPAARRACPALS